MDDRPDWGRIAVNSRASDTLGVRQTPLGDASRWGSQGVIKLQGSSVLCYSEQLVRVQPVDVYARNWQAIGNIAMFQEFWDLDATTLKLWLEVTMGAGQNALLQNFNLRALVDLAAPWYIDGGNGLQVVKSWAIAGGIVGCAVNARVVAQLSTPLAPGIATIGVAAQISPYSSSGYT